LSFEKVVLANLVHSEGFARKVIPFLRSEYFADRPDRTIFELIQSYMVKYNSSPSREALAIDLTNRRGVGEDEFAQARDTIANMEVDPATKEEWLVDETEKFCRDRAVFNAVMESVRILDDKTTQLHRGSIPGLLSDALAVSFDKHVGHDLLEDFGTRYDYYHRVEKRIPFDIEFMNRATNGGIEKKTLNIVSGGTGIGKTTILCHFASNDLRAGLSVLYITLEMAEEKIAQRIDANVLDQTMLDLETMSRDQYVRLVDQVRSRTSGRLIIKEYPTTCAGANHFRHLLNELKLKKNFVPDVIYIDYINLCQSCRLKVSGVKSYEYVKSIAEELRGLAVETNVAIWSATQLNRTGFADSDPGLEHTSDSFGLPMTVDLMWIVSQSEEMKALGQLVFRQTDKNRYTNTDDFRRFVVGIDRTRMKLYNVDEREQNLVDDRPVFDKSGTAAALKRTVFEDFV
jgi:archaellum biogenesis ATPase FlaH